MSLLTDKLTQIESAVDFLIKSYISHPEKDGVLKYIQWLIMDCQQEAENIEPDRDHMRDLTTALNHLYQALPEGFEHKAKAAAASLLDDIPF